MRSKLLVVLALASIGYCQTPVVIPDAVISPVPWREFLDSNGRPLAGGKLCTYVAGTTSGGTSDCPDGTPLDTYTDNTANVKNTNPIVLNSAGRAQIWIGTGPYKFVLKNLYGVTVWTEDNIMEPSFAFLKGVQSVGDSAFLTYVATDGVTQSVWSKLSQIVNVLDYDAKCDGGTDDTTAIQTAMTKAAAAGAPLHFPDATCVTGKLTIPVTLDLIEANGTILKAKVGLNDTVLYGTGLTSLKIQGHLTIDGNKANQGSGAPYGLSLHASSGVVLDALAVKDTYSHGVYIDASSDIKIGNVSISGAGGSCVALATDARIQIVNLDLNGCTADNLALSAVTYSQFSSIISRASTSGHGISLSSTSQHNAFGVLDLSGNGLSDLYLAAADNSYNAFSSVHTSGSPGGVECNSDYDVFGEIVAVSTSATTGTPTGAGVFVGGNHNTFASVSAALNKGPGLKVEGLPTFSGGGSGNVFSSVVAINNSQYGAGSYAGVSLVGAMHTVIGALRATDDQAGTTQGWGVKSEAVSGYNVIGNADLWGNLTDDYVIQVSDVVQYREVVGGGNVYTIDSAETDVVSTTTTPSAPIFKVFSTETPTAPLAGFNYGIRLNGDTTKWTDITTNVDLIFDTAGVYGTGLTAQLPDATVLFHVGMDGSMNIPGSLSVYNPVTSGVTQQTIKMGSGQSATAPFQIEDNTSTVVFNVDQTGVPLSIPLKSNTGNRFVCVDTNGKFVSSATACSGT
jgi:hypothetical protein